MTAFDPIADISVTTLTSSGGGALILQKDDVEHPVPEPLRSTFRQIADAFVAGDFQLRHHPIDGVRPIDPDTAKWIADNVSAYGETLALLGRIRVNFQSLHRKESVEPTNPPADPV
jgi:hypothetical protein